VVKAYFKALNFKLTRTAMAPMPETDRDIRETTVQCSPLSDKSITTGAVNR
jgi:hypothetical protein